MLCGHCGHDNPEQNRYCGMCGSRLETPPAKPAEVASLDQAAQPVRASAGTSILGLDAEPQPRRPTKPGPAITGPSFLGLGTEPGPTGTNYLLEDDEPRGHLGLWITLVLLVAVALAGLHFRAEVRARAGQLYAAVLARVNPQPPAPPAPPAPTPNPSPVGGEASPGAPAPDVPTDANLANAPAGTATHPATTPPAELKPDDAAAKTTAAAEKPERAQPAKPDADTTKDVSEPTHPARRAGVHRARRAPADTAPSEDSPLLQLARKYIHGQGVRRDCATGMAYLREAMKRPNAAAASQMGALYATGTCVPLDRVAAYRWFSSALQMAPSNSWLARERDELYGQMSSAERHRANRQ